MFTIATYRFLLPSGCVLRITRNFVVHSKLYQVEKRETSQSKLVQSSTSQNNINTSSIGEKVKDAGKTLWYSGIVIVGFLATGAILFAVIKELFSNQSPQYIYSDALKKCTEFPRVCDLLGEPIVGFCEGSGRRSRTVLRPHTFLKNNVEHMQLRFYIKGIRNQATVRVEMEKKNGKFEYLYIVAETENYPKEKIFVLDNRIQQEPSFQF